MVLGEDPAHLPKKQPFTYTTTILPSFTEDIGSLGRPVGVIGVPVAQYRDQHMTRVFVDYVVGLGSTDLVALVLFVSLHEEPGKDSRLR